MIQIDSMRYTDVNTFFTIIEYNFYQFLISY